MLIIVDDVDDGGEGFLRTYVNGELVQSDDTNYFYQELLSKLGYELLFIRQEELGNDD